MLYEKLLSTVFPLDEPTSRLYHLNILMGFLIALGWILIRYKRAKMNARKTAKLVKLILFNPNYWLHQSALVDYALFIINGVFKALLLVPMLDISYRVGQYTLSFVKWIGFHDQNIFETTTSNVILFTLVVFVLDDFLRFVHHVLMHKIPLLWFFHRTHHSAKVLTPITLFRTHPVESLQAVLRNGLSLGIASGLFVGLFGSSLSLWTILGVNGFGFIFNLAGSILRHSQIPISFGILESVFISPKQHQVHHSRDTQHIDKNFGVSLAIWDRIFGSLIYSAQVKKIRFGLN
jgi:sterol desaturase/sphingolipid hydroxylase (fatty acid hydroxylase superfamily)